MTPKLFGRAPSQEKGKTLIWRGRGWRVDVFPVNGTWRWHLCLSHDGVAVVDHFSPHQHPTPAAAARSVSSVIRSVVRRGASIIGEGS
jgi:hypothetical protein